MVADRGLLVSRTRSLSPTDFRILVVYQPFEADQTG